MSEPGPPLLRVGADAAGLRADAFLARELPYVSRTRLRQKVQMGEAFLNGRRFATSTRLRSGDLITIQWRAAPRTDPVQPFTVLWEDESFLAVDKPAGIASHPMGHTQTGTVVQFARQRHLLEIRRSLEHGDGGFYPTLVNRLDTFTSGIVLVAKTILAYRVMQAVVVQRLVQKEYQALVEGVLSEESGKIELPIGPDATSTIRVKRECRDDGLASSTAWEATRRFDGYTLVRAMPLTGRQHQIRIHFASVGHPIYGDLLYKDESLFLRYQESRGTIDDSLPKRQCLHAGQVRFTHPLTGHEILIESPLPEDFQSILNGLS